MSWKDAPLAKDYGTLAKQFRALKSLTASFEAQLRYFQNDRHAEITARSQVDGERAANDILTAEIERLHAAAPTDDAYDLACAALAHWRAEAKRLGEIAGEAPREMNQK